jgi:hypothetical protein
MILVRPTLPGENAIVGSTPDGIPLPSNAPWDITIAKYGPAVTQEWYCRNFAAISFTTEQLIVIEYIWDVRPCKRFPVGVCHQILRPGASGGESASWVKVASANPQRFALTMSVFASLSGQPTGVIAIG